ncbi:MarR family winged helix-turn-helix transcriptional regulator [Sphingomonas sp.]|uniref:MarR family winged helix-turn-helix transcriptional regulator n=1 Tax=Sphingomonas sp. TaxID=28214 RepID=UPI002BAD7C5A|nr:MarR family transcriptional regulator [Sphingomonas sp.]HTG39442.1 MarR family transcriptional regulator [Sphingomonas sp.]
MRRIREPVAATIPSDEGAGDIGEIRDIVGFHIRLAHGAVYRHFTETFGHLELTQKQVAAMWLVDNHPDIAQSTLAKRMRMDRATMMAIVNRLEARGYLSRGRSATDGRKQTLNLTDEGRRALATAKVAVRAHEDWLKARYSPAEVETLIALLTRLHSE